MATWDDAFEDSPPGSELIALGDDRIRAFKEEVRIRGEVERNWGTVTAGYTDDGRLNPGAARAFAGIATPTALKRFNGTNHPSLPGGSLPALGVNDKGRLWLDENTTPPTLKYWNGTAWVDVVVSGGGGGGGGGGGIGDTPYRNHFINGSLEVWQRGFTVAFINPAATNIYRADRWFVRDETGAIGSTMIRVSTGLPTGSVSRFALECEGMTGGTTLDIGQRIEASTAWMIKQAQFITVSARVKYDDGAAGSTTPLLMLGTPSVENSFGLVTPQNGAGQAHATAVTDGQLVWPGIDVSAFTNINLGLEVKIRFPTFNLGKTITITDLQIESASAFSAFEFRPLATEIELCQRYYEKTFPYNVAPLDGQPVAGALTTKSGHSGDPERDIGLNWRFNVPKITLNAGYDVTFYTPGSAASPGRFWNLSGQPLGTPVITDVVGTTSITSLSMQGEFGTGVGHLGTLAGNHQAKVLCIHAVADAEL